jgi:DNA-binding transcriptional MerR regulator
MIHREDSMRIAELSRRSGVSVPTIKYYVRERLLAPGARTSPNQAQYDEGHLHRLKLIRALVDVGGLSIAATRDVLDSIDSPGTLHETLGKAQHAVTPTLEAEVDEESWARASRQVEEFARRRSWEVKPTHPAWQLLTHVLAALDVLGQGDLAALLDDYADVAERIAEFEVPCVLSRQDLDSILESVVIGTALGDSLLAAVRRLAQANVSARLTAGAPTRRAERTGSVQRQPRGTVTARPD